MASTTKTAEPQLELTRLDNELQILTRRVPELQSVGFAFSVNYGTYHDLNVSRKPTAHFLEHTLFEGTATRSAKKIKDERDALTSDSNGATGMEYTCYYFQTHRDDINEALSLFSDMILNSTLNKQDIDRERGPVNQEYASNAQEPTLPASETLMAELYSGHPASKSTIFTKEEVDSVTRNDLKASYSTNYTPDNSALCLYGGFSEDVPKRLSEMFAPFSGTFSGTRIEPPSLQQQAKEVILKSEKVEQTIINMGMKTPSLSQTKDRVTDLSNEIMVAILGRLLHEKVRLEEGLAYGIFAETSDTGTVSNTRISTGVRQEKEEITKTEIYKLVTAVASGEISSDRLEREKRIGRRGYLLSRDNTLSSARRCATRTVLFKDPLSFNSVQSMYDSVTLDTVREAAANNLSIDRAVTILLRPSE